MRKSYGKIHNHTMSIGITGTARHVGVTHLAIMLANYLSSKERCQVAVLDQSQSQSFRALQKIYEGTFQSGMDLVENYFQVHKVDYYSQVTKKDIADIQAKGYEYVIIDYGKLEVSDFDYEILKCSVKILVGSCCEWEQEAFCQVLGRTELISHRQQWTFGAFLGSTGIRRAIEKKYHIQIHTIPFEEDPFMLHRSHFEAFKDMLQEVL